MRWAARLGGVLLVTCVALQLTGVIAGPVLTGATATIPQWARLPGTFLLVLYGLVGWLSRTGSGRRYAGLIFGGMFLGHLGDLAMGGIIPSPNGWLAGMLFFGLGHGFYIVAFLMLQRSLGVYGLHPALPVLLVLGTLLWLGLTAGSDETAVMRYGALAYTLIICLMTGLALALAVSMSRLWPIALGAFLFLLSDILLGASAFRGLPGNLWHDTIWVLYITGQILLVTSPKCYRT